MASVKGGITGEAGKLMMLLRSALFFFFLLSMANSYCCGQQIMDDHVSRLEGTIILDGSELSYVAEGVGAPCLVIGSSVYYPRTFSKDLRRHFRFYFVDLRWFARSSGPIDLSKYDLKELVSDIERIRTALKLDKPILIGHSIHGTIAMEYAKRYPAEISRLVMIGSPNYFGNVIYDKATEEVWDRASAGRKSKLDSNWKMFADRDTLDGASTIVEEYCVMAPKYWFDSSYDAHWLWKDMRIDAPLTHHLYNDMFHDYRMFSHGEAAPVPTFVAMGQFDFVIPSLMWEREGEIRGLTLHVFERSGHTPQLEEPEKFDRAFMDWVKSR